MTDSTEKISAIAFILEDIGSQCQIGFAESVIRRVYFASECWSFKQTPDICCGLTVQCSGFDEGRAFEILMQVPNYVCTDGLVIEAHNLVLFSEFYQFV